MTCFRRRFLLAGLSLVALGGCSSTQIVDDLPGVIGLPQEAPARPATPYQFPAVHDMPPPRPTEPMSAEDQLRMEKELSTARDRQENGKAAAEKTSQPAKKAPKKDTKQKPVDEQSGGTAGAKPNP